MNTLLALPAPRVRSRFNSFQIGQAVWFRGDDSMPWEPGVITDKFVYHNEPYRAERFAEMVWLEHRDGKGCFFPWQVKARRGVTKGNERLAFSHLRAERKHRRFPVLVKTSDGDVRAHITGDPRMPNKTREALKELARALYEKIKSGQIGGECSIHIEGGPVR